MGNCIRKESSTQWGGDDWGSPTPAVQSEATKSMFSSDIRHDKKLHTNQMKMEEQSFLADNKTSNSSLPSSTTSGTEVKIKITKKQLEELLSKVDVHGQPVKDVLTQLLNLSDEHETHPGSWRPALQSIPEAELY